VIHAKGQRDALTVLRAAAVVLDGGVVAILDRAASGVLDGLAAAGATPFCDDLLGVDTEHGGSVVARCNGSALPLRAVIVLDRGEAFVVDRSPDALSLLEHAVEAGSRGPEQLEWQIGTCMTITRVAALLEAQVPPGMDASETARRLFAAL
jgi:hypothetical protein